MPSGRRGVGRGGRRALTAATVQRAARSLHPWADMRMASIDEITIADEPGSWEDLGFLVDGDSCQLAGVRLRFAGRSAGEGIVGWSLRELAGDDLDGLPTTGSAAPVRPPAPAHPNGVLAIDHIVAISPAFERSVGALEAAGLDLRRVREEPTPAGAPRQAFFRLGQEILELVEEPAEVLERSGGPERPVRFWGLALLVEDIDRTVELMAPHAPPARDAVQPGRRISTVRRSAGLAVPIALMSRGEDRP